MTLALTAYQAYGIYRDEPLTKKPAFQFLRLQGTGANTDATYDFGNYSGTFWTAVGATQPGADALYAIKDIQTRAQEYLNLIGGLGINGKSQIDSSRTLITKLDSAATAGGNATETCTVTGLLTTDVLLSVVQFVDGAGAAVGILAWGGATGVCSVADQLSVTWNADPGAGAKIRVAVSRAAGSTTPDAGTYQIAMDGTNIKLPNLTFASGDAPTAFDILIAWVLKDGEQPVLAARTA